MNAAPRPRRRTGRSGLGLGALSASAVLAACGTTPASTTTATQAAEPPAPSLATAVDSPSGTWATVAMGLLSDPANTFWQVLVLPSASGRWTLRTPPGVADNGGLIVSAGGRRVVVGFRPSQDLRFSPVALTTDGGQSYTAGLVPAGLPALPGSLVVDADGRVTGVAGNAVLQASPGAVTLHPIITVAALDAVPALRACSPGPVRALSTGDGRLFVAVACGRPDQVGIVRFASASSPTSAVAVGPRLGSLASGAAVDVLRFASYRQGVAALLAVRTGTTTRYVGAWDPSGGDSWTFSARWRPAGPVASVSVTSADGFAVLTSPAGGAAAGAAVIAPSSPGWSVLPSPPAGTAVVAVTGTRVDALAGGRTQFVDSVLAGGRWVRRQLTAVAIPFGSSG